jgi:predicted nuclease of predicted toxin-antitoxin system
MACPSAPAGVSESLLLDEHYSDAIAAELRAAGHDVIAVVADPQLRAQSDLEVFRQAAASGRRIVTENIKDFRPLLQQAYAAGDPTARLLLVPPNRFPRGAGRRSAAIVKAVSEWLATAEVAGCPHEDWLV